MNGSTTNTAAPLPAEATPTAATTAAPAAAPAVLSVYLRLVCVALFWGGTFIAGRYIAQSVPVLMAATIRFAIAVPLLMLVAWKFEGGLPRLNRSQLLMTFCLGLTGIFLYNICFFAALARMPAGRTALFVALNPIVTALLLALLLRERLGIMRWIGIVIAFIGAAIVITRGDLASAWHDITQAVGVGELLMLCAITGWAAYTIIGRFALQGLSPVAATTYASLWGLALLACGAAAELASFDWSVLSWQMFAAIAYLGVFGTVAGFVWYYQGVKAIGPARTAVFNNLVPVFGILLAALLLDEPILVSMVVGGALVIGGVTVTNRQR